jgi:hypothetical protein
MCGLKKYIFQVTGVGTDKVNFCCVHFLHTWLLKNKYTLLKIYFTKTTDAKFMFYVRMERKSLKVLILMI